MARVTFTEDFDWRPARNVVIAYKAGMTLTVTRRCAQKAKAERKAREVRAQRPAEAGDL